MNKENIWFAWYPVRLGELGTGRRVWLQYVWRNECMGVTIYQPLEMAIEAYESIQKALGKSKNVTL